jgi:GTP-binding protein
MFVDEVKLKIIAGRGGNGRASFFPGKGGPSGGNGGNGGSVFIGINKQMANLNKYSGISQFVGIDGEPGGQNRRQGLHGKEVTIEVPIGTTVLDLNSKEQTELTEQRPRVLVCKGGDGGRGNDAFKSATNQTPKKATLGLPGQVRDLQLIQKLIADYGLIGIPNAGKSTLLNELTAAKAQTANYAFTTLEPNLGVYDKKVIADIPGLIEGASSGKGLGIKFLKHIEKVKLLIHCISAESKDVVNDFETVMNELTQYNAIVAKKDMIVLLTKIDLVPESEVEEKVAALKKVYDKVYPISVIDPESIATLKKLLS